MSKWPAFTLLLLLTAATARAEVIGLSLGPDYRPGFPTSATYLTPFAPAPMGWPHGYDAQVTSIPSPFGGQLEFSEAVDHYNSSGAYPVIAAARLVSAPYRLTLSLPTGVGLFAFSVLPITDEPPVLADEDDWPSSGPKLSATVTADGGPSLTLPTTDSAQRVLFYGTDGEAIRSVTIDFQGEGRFGYQLFNLAAHPTPTPAAVPEPGTLGLLGVGAACLLGFRRRRG